MVDVYIGARDVAELSAPRSLQLKSPLVQYAGETGAKEPSALLVKRQ
jgi:hypothetical protein